MESMTVLISGSHNAFTNGYNTAGIYMASGLAPSSFDQPIYIGSSVDIKKRILRGHIPQLKNKNHKNLPFRNYASKNGVESIVWFLLEPCSRETLVERENFYLQKYKPFVDNKRGFNIAEDAARPLFGHKLSEESKRKRLETLKANPMSPERLKLKNERISQSNKGKKRTEEQRKLMSERFRGRVWSDQAKQNLAKGKENSILFKQKDWKRRKTLWLTNERTGETLLVTGIVPFAKDIGINPGNLQQVGVGKRRSEKGWRLATEEEIRNTT